MSEPLGSVSDSPPPPGEAPTPETTRSGWLWVPTLYFFEGVPNAVVSDTAKVLYTDLGLSAAQLGLVTGSMYLPWFLKPLWGPLVDLVKSKRWWIVVTQLALAAAFFALSMSLHLEHWLICSAAALWVMAFVSATHDIAADGFYMMGLNEQDQAAFTGIRSTCYRLAMLCSKGALVALAGYLVLQMGVQGGWSSAMAIPAALYLAAALYHGFMLPHPKGDYPTAGDNFTRDYWSTFVTFFQKPGILTAMAFILLFRLAEAQVLAMAAPFLKSPLAQGGLNMSTEQYGISYGTFGMLGIITGGILAGFLVARFGLRRLYWLMMVIMHTPNLAFLYLASAQPDSLLLIRSCLFIEQFGYGFGFTAYMLYLMYFSRGTQQTSHYAICTGFMALSLMLPNMLSGIVKDALGFVGFFGYILACTIPSFWVAWLAWRDHQFIDHFSGKPH